MKKYDSAIPILICLSYKPSGDTVVNKDQHALKLPCRRW